MGICSSSNATQIATAKLILQDGRLKEFDYPVKASMAVAKMNDPSCFICDSDEMEFDGVVRAIGDDDELLPGQLYFALPMARLRTKLHAQDMASLARKASSALGTADFYALQRITTTDRHNHNYKDSSSSSSRDSRDSGRRGKRRGNSSDKFTAMLTSIPE